MDFGAEQNPRGVSPRRKHCCAMAMGEGCPRASVAAIAQSQSRIRNRRIELRPLTRRPRNSSTFSMRVNETVWNRPTCDYFEPQNGPERQLALAFGVYPPLEKALFNRAPAPFSILPVITVAYAPGGRTLAHQTSVDARGQS
jgi:hypothetical protein